MRRALVGAVLVGTALVLAALGVAGPAAAHTDTGTFTATRAEPAGDGTYTIDLLLTYDNDGHGAVGAALTVSVQGPTGSPVPVTMAPGERDGAYTGTVAVSDPGDYVVTASSTDPEAQSTFTFTVAAPTTTTTTAEATTTTDGAEPSDDEAGPTTTAAGDEDSGTAASVAAIAALALIGAAAAFFGLRWWRGRRNDTTAG
ncbi:MAG TPA: hypothetical protein PKA98_03560 [Acidimicrobiales bacterium]|nr:hypothetical protein [Acidimicrobiales bacterium]